MLHFFRFSPNTSSDFIESHGIAVRVLGDLTLLPSYLQLTLAKVMQSSRRNTRAVLNICFAYSSRSECERAAHELAEGLTRHELNLRFVAAWKAFLCVVCVCV
jgi:undecaprenyl diphosphate synthase